MIGKWSLPCWSGHTEKFNLVPIGEEHIARSMEDGVPYCGLI